MLCACVDPCDSKDARRVGHEWLFQTVDTFHLVAYKTALPSNPPFQILLQTPGWLGEIIRSSNIGGRKHILLDDLWPLLTQSSEVVSTLYRFDTTSATLEVDAVHYPPGASHGIGRWSRLPGLTVTGSTFPSRRSRSSRAVCPLRSSLYLSLILSSQPENQGGAEEPAVDQSCEL